MDLHIVDPRHLKRNVTAIFLLTQAPLGPSGGAGVTVVRLVKEAPDTNGGSV